MGAAIAGVALGYVAGTLTAPASGKETRKRIGRRVEEERRAAAAKARRSIAVAKDEARALAGKARRSVVSAKEEARKSVRKAQDKLADKIHS